MGKEYFDSLLKRGVEEVIVEEELVELLCSDKQLRIKQGFDPSCPDIHLGHAVGLRKLREFQEMGHQVVLIVGDLTSQIGDPSGESKTRPMLSTEEVLANAETYMEQFFKIVDKEKTEVRWQSEWLSMFTLHDVISLTSKFTIAQFLAREDFSKRYSSGRPIAITEFLYPLLQGYDSVMIRADVELGGTDQKFNCLVGRELQAMMGQPPQQVLLVPLLVGTGGKQKMSKTLNNYIGITEPPDEMYGKVMSIPDTLIVHYFELVTDIPGGELDELRQELATQSVNPMMLKKRLAHEIVAQFHSEKAAEEACGKFERVFQMREIPEEIPEYAVSFESLFGQLHNAVLSSQGKVSLTPIMLSQLLHQGGFARSHQEAKRLISQGAIEVDGKKIADDADSVSIHSGSIIRAGKRRFVRIVNADKNPARKEA